MAIRRPEHVKTPLEGEQTMHPLEFSPYCLPQNLKPRSLISQLMASHPIFKSSHELHLEWVIGGTCKVDALFC